MRIFVSYTTRDDVVSVRMLRRLYSELLEYGQPFIDLLHNTDIEPQRRIFRELATADLFVVLLSPGLLASPWVRCELNVAYARGIPQFGVHVSEHLPAELMDDRAVLSNKALQLTANPLRGLPAAELGR